MTTPTDFADLGRRMRTASRTALIVSAVLGIVLGILALIWPGVTLLTVAFLFGAYLVVAGVFRLVFAFAAEGVGGGTRWLIGILGALVLVAGIIALANPFSSLLAIAIVIGLGWIFEGVMDLVGAATGHIRAPRWLTVLSGVVSVIAGVVVLFLPGAALATFVLWGAILLIVVSVTTLLTLPRSPRRA